MKTKTIDAAHMLIILTAQESQSLGISPDSMCWNSLHCRLAIARIFLAACAGTNFAANTNKIELKAMATADGECVLIFSTNPAVKPKRKLYKIKTSSGPYVYQFRDAGDVLNTIERLYRAKLDCPDCTLLRSSSFGYRLVISPPYALCSAVSGILTEYGTLCGKGKTAAAFAMEDGQIICKDAIRTAGIYLI